MDVCGQVQERSHKFYNYPVSELLLRSVASTKKEHWDFLNSGIYVSMQYINK